MTGPSPSCTGSLLPRKRGYESASRNPSCVLVGTAGLEPAAPCTPCKCATRLRYVPIRGKCILPDGGGEVTSILRIARGPDSAEIVLQPLDVVLPEVLPHLHLDHDQVFPADALDAVQCAQGDVDVLPRGKPQPFAAARHFRLAPDHLPVLRPETVPLEAQPPAGADDELLDLVPLALVEHQVMAPRALGTLHPRSSSRAAPRWGRFIRFHCRQDTTDYFSIALILESSFFRSRSSLRNGFSASSSFIWCRSLASSFSFERAPSMVNRSS